MRVKRPKNSYVHSVAQLERMVGFDSRGFLGTKKKFYPVGKLGGGERYTAFYSGGGTASHTFILLRADDKFPKLDAKKKLAERIAWDRSKWPGFIALLQNVENKRLGANKDPNKDLTEAESK
jgi:hypothetical protein